MTNEEFEQLWITVALGQPVKTVEGTHMREFHTVESGLMYYINTDIGPGTNKHITWTSSVAFNDVRYNDGWLRGQVVLDD